MSYQITTRNPSKVTSISSSVKFFRQYKERPQVPITLCCLTGSAVKSGLILGNVCLILHVGFTSHLNQHSQVSSSQLWEGVIER